MQWTVETLARELEVDFAGDGATVLTRAGSLETSEPGTLSFLVPGTALERLTATRAAAVVVPPGMAAWAPCPVLLSDEPYLQFARASQRLHPLPPARPGVSAGAGVAETARVDPGAQVDAGAVIEADARIDGGAIVGAGCVIGEGARIGADTRLGARVIVGAHCEFGERCIVQPGAVIGSDGFGFAPDGDRWTRIPQVGRVRIGSDVAIGANTTIDRGTSEDTVIADGVILDNQIQIAHNVRIGAGTAMAGCVGVAGSAVIGARCTIGGAAVILGHLEIVDDVHVTAMSMVSKSITLPGTWSSGVPLEPNRDWRRNAARFRQLDRLARRISALERKQTGNE